MLGVGLDDGIPAHAQSTRFVVVLDHQTRVHVRYTFYLSRYSHRNQPSGSHVATLVPVSFLRSFCVTEISERALPVHVRCHLSRSDRQLHCARSNRSHLSQMNTQTQRRWTRIESPTTSDPKEHWEWITRGCQEPRAKIGQATCGISVRLPTALTLHQLI